jgi:hypothetical protein
MHLEPISVAEFTQKIWIWKSFPASEAEGIPAARVNKAVDALEGERQKNIKTLRP